MNNASNDDHATSTNKGIWEALNTTNHTVSGQQPGESAASYETRGGAFNYQRAVDAQKAEAQKKGS